MSLDTVAPKPDLWILGHAWLSLQLARAVFSRCHRDGCRIFLSSFPGYSGVPVGPGVGSCTVAIDAGRSFDGKPRKATENALLRWQELDPVAATALMRKEVVQSAPRFSSLYIRLPDKSLPAEEQQQLAANFVALSSPQELITEATFVAPLCDECDVIDCASLHRPASRWVALRGATAGIGIPLEGFSGRCAHPTGRAAESSTASLLSPRPIFLEYRFHTSRPGAG